MSGNKKSSVFSIKALFKKHVATILFFTVMSLTVGVPLAEAVDVPGALVSTTWLMQQASGSNVIILDIRDNDQDYLKRGHIPGARLWDMATTKNMVDLKGIDQVLPTANGVTELLQKLGVSNNDSVILTENAASASDVTFGTRAYWALRYYGIKNVAILDGGTGKWASEELPLSHDPMAVLAPGTFEAGVPPVEIASTLVGVGQAYEMFSKKKVQFIDARPSNVFKGESKPPFDPKYGHIPGAINWPASALLNNHGSMNQDFPAYYTFKNQKEIEASAREHHVNLAKLNVVYCDTGHLSSGVFFAWREVLKRDNLSFFPGSMKVWGGMNLPVATGN